MVGNFGEVQVMDWGLAKDLTNREIAAETRIWEAPPLPVVGFDPAQTTDRCIGSRGEGVRQRKKRRVQLAVAAQPSAAWCPPAAHSAGGRTGSRKEPPFRSHRLAAALPRRSGRANNQQIEALLDRSEAAIKEEDDVVGRSSSRWAKVEKRAANLEADHLKERLARCCPATNLPADLDLDRRLRYVPQRRAIRGPYGSGRGRFVRIGVIVGHPPPGAGG